MRVIQKTDLDSNTKKMEIIEDGVSIATACTPSIPAFKTNAINELELALEKVNKPALTNEEKALVQSWIDEA